MHIYQILFVKKDKEKIIIEYVNINGISSIEVENEGHAIMDGEYLKLSNDKVLWGLFFNDHQWIELKKYQKKTIFIKILNFLTKKLKNIRFYP